MSSTGPTSGAAAVALESAAAEIEAFIGQGGWDTPAALFALVPTSEFTAGAQGAHTHGLTPVEQERLPAGDLDAALAQVAWPDTVAGCALSQHIVILPPSAESAFGEDPSAITAEAAAAHPQRREARLVAAVLRDGTSAVVLRLRGERDAGNDAASDAASSEDSDLLIGADLAPNLVQALLATLD